MAISPKIIEINPETLYGVDVFRALSSVDRKELSKLCKCRRYSPDQQIISYQDNTRDVFFIISGRVSALIYSFSGKQITFQDLNAGQMFGELSAIDGQPRSAHIVAATESLIAFMSPSDFWTALRKYPAVTEATLKRLTSMVRLLAEKVYEVSVLPVKDRIHAELLRLALQQMHDETTAVISPAPTHAEFASHIGTHREAVTRELVGLKNSGLIDRRSGALIVHDVPRLTRMVNEVLGQHQARHG